MTGCRFSARNYKNLDPIKNKRSQIDQNVNILPGMKLTKNGPQTTGIVVGSKLLTSVKDLRKSIKNLMAICDEKGSCFDSNKTKKFECQSSQVKSRQSRRPNVFKSNQLNLEYGRLITNKSSNLNDHKYLDSKAIRNSPSFSNKSKQLFNAKQSNIVRLLDQNLNDDLLLKMGIRHTSRFGNSAMRNSKSVYDYEMECNENNVKQCSLLKYSMSFPINIENEARQQPGHDLNSIHKANKTCKKNKIKKSDQSNKNQIANRYSVQSEFQPKSPKKPIYKTQSISLDYSEKELDSLVIAKALVIQQFTPSPYDTNSLCLKIGDVIDVIDMNETGIWTGILNKKIGKFKFIYVKLIETQKNKKENLKKSPEELVSSLESSSSSSIIESCVSGSLTINNLRSYKSSLAYGLNLETKKINTSSNYNQKKFKSLSYGYLNSICYRLNENKRGATNRSGSVPVYTRLDKQYINFSQLQYSTSVTTDNQTFGHSKSDKNHDHNCMRTKASQARCKSLKSKVNYRKRTNMGQKQFRSSNDLFTDLIDDKNSIKKKTASVSSDSSTSSKAKSNHDSHLSNDSGCYSNIDRYSSPSDSSVLAEFKSRTLTRKSQKNRNSLCDSVILSCSSSDSSINVEISDDSNKKAQLLCDQLNQILNLSSSTGQKPTMTETELAINKQVNRSHTFNANEKIQRNVNKNLDEAQKKSKISNLVKSSRKFFAWSPTSVQKTNDLPVIKQNLKHNKKLCDLLAAKLASENIDLASVPFTDEMGFCKVPIALLKRYATELGQDINLLAKCFESERLTQIEKSGKLGIPNDFMYKECKCKKSICESIKWKLCKCDIDSSSLENFLFSLGLPMYIDKFKQRNIVNTLQDLKRLVDINDHKQFEIAASTNVQSSANTKSHFKILSNSIVFCDI